jgi:PAS domain S-box-containing protein
MGGEPSTPPGGDSGDRVPFQVLLDAMPDGIVLSDLEGRIELVSDRLLEMTGFAREELVGRSIESLVPQGLRAAHRDHRSAYVASGLPTRPMGRATQLVLVTKSGVHLPVDIALRAIETGGRQLVVSAVRDARERIRAAEAEWAYRERLAVIEDREHMAKELRDGLVHALFAVGLRLQAAVAAADVETHLADQIEQAVSDIDQAISDLRRYLFTLDRTSLLRDGDRWDAVARDEKAPGPSDG